MTNNNGHDVAYLRVSSLDQKTDRQLEGLEFEKKFIEKASGKNTKRPVLDECIEYLRQGDVLHVHSIDRLARNLFDLQDLINKILEKGISIKFHKENLIFTGDSDNPIQKLQLQMMGAFAEFERSMIKERQREGIKIAQKKGVKFGAKKKLTNTQVEEIKSRIANGAEKKALAEEFGISRQTLYNTIK